MTGNRREDASRLQDIEHKDEVEMLGDNRAVIRTGGSNKKNDPAQVTVSVTIESPKGPIQKNFNGETEDEAMKKMFKWYKKKRR